MKRNIFRDRKEKETLTRLWAALEKNNPYKGMTTKEVLRKIRSEP